MSESSITPCRFCGSTSIPQIDVGVRMMLPPLDKPIVGTTTYCLSCFKEQCSFMVNHIEDVIVRDAEECLAAYYKKVAENEEFNADMDDIMEEENIRMHYPSNVKAIRPLVYPTPPSAH